MKTYIVTGLPRSGTSMTMMILDKGGIPAVYDERIHKDINPYGSFETGNIGDITQHVGKCVKCLAPQLLFDLPIGDYKVIMPRRDPEQIVFSRVEAFKQKAIGNIEKQKELVDRQVRFIKFVVEHRPDMESLEIPFPDYYLTPEKVVDDIATFVETTFDKVEAVKAIDITLYKVRTLAEVTAMVAANKNVTITPTKPPVV